MASLQERSRESKSPHPLFISSVDSNHLYDDLPVLPLIGLEKIVLAHNYNYYSRSGKRFIDPVIIDLAGTSHDFVLVNDDVRTDVYLERAHQLANGILPPSRPAVSYFSPHGMHIGKINGSLFMLKRESYLPAQCMVIPEPVEDNYSGFWAKDHDVSNLEIKDLELMGKLAQEKWVVWFNGAFPTQPMLHYHAMSESVDEKTVLFPLVTASLEERHGMTSIMINNDENNAPIHSPCYATRNASEALQKLTLFTSAGHPPDMCVVRGQKEPLYVLFPTKGAKDIRGYVVDLFPASENPEWWNIGWYWLPSAENIGFILKPSFLQIDVSSREVVITDSKEKVHRFPLEWFIAHMRRKFDSLHISEDEVRKIVG